MRMGITVEFSQTPNRTVTKTYYYIEDFIWNKNIVSYWKHGLGNLYREIQKSVSRAYVIISFYVIIS